MSIPPLVCSTPPPPEQCEDDKDPEDFDITYLSQEDDDGTEYNFGNYSSYDIYSDKSGHIESEKWPPHFRDNLESKQDQLKSEDVTSRVNFTSDNIFTESVDKYEENILEDLNLKVETNEHSNNISIQDCETNCENHNSKDNSEKDIRIQDQGGTDVIENLKQNIDIKDCLGELENNTASEYEHLDTENSEANKSICEITETNQLNSKNDDNVNEEVPSPNNTLILQKKLEIEGEVHAITDIPEQIQVEKELPKCEDSCFNDDFGDFEDFEYRSANDIQALPTSSDNPWNNTTEGTEFSTFTAHFDSNPQEFENSTNNQKEYKVLCEKNDCEYEDDDFGDFDDFRSSGQNVEDLKDPQNILNTSNVPVLNLQSHESETQIVDTLNNVLCSIFTNELCKPDGSLDDKLELHLGETWGHLMDIDVRQPYMVNWNNSLGQKTLLKALAIDSRNILFGPKWHNGMPKYATNLTTAPLQPQKQQAQISISNNISTEKVVDKESNKESSTWVDPFTTDGQESCSTENKGQNIDSAKRPSELEVFGNEHFKQINKIYSNTIDIQPLRHINLPDTHIFTPTDSETPRSKTIHYDTKTASVPSVKQNDKNISELQTDESCPAESDNEYWEFQDFKGTNTGGSVVKESSQVIEDKMSNVLSDNLPKGAVSYQSQILQPIKMEPIIPTLNWPDPGEVKETFDNFSDFVSSISWTYDKDNAPDVQSESGKNEEKMPEDETVRDDDEFKTFQSAPSSSTATGFSNQNKTPDNVGENITEDNLGMTDMKVESTIELQNCNFSQNSSGSSVTYPVSSNVLHPTSSVTSGPIQTQLTTGQILQPLSLESYSQINWPNPGINLQDLSRFNPINSLQSFKSDVNTNNSKGASPAHNTGNVKSDISDDDIWGDFVSSIPKRQSSPKKLTFPDDDEWTDFVSSPSIRPQNGLNTISLNVHTNLSMQKSASQSKISSRSNQATLDIPTLNYITPKSNNRGIYTEKHIQNL